MVGKQIELDLEAGKSCTPTYVLTMPPMAHGSKHMLKPFVL